LAGAIKENPAHARIGIVLTGANVDAPLYAEVLAGGFNDEEG